MRGEIDRFAWNTVAFEIVRTRTQCALAQREAPRDQTRIGELTDADREIETALDQIDVLIAQMHVELR